MKFQQLWLLFVFLLGMALSAPSTLVAAEIKFPQTVAIQSRPYWLKHELSLGIGYWPLDHFNTYISGSATYAYYFNDYLAWELFNGQMMYSTSTGLETYLSRAYGAQPEAFDVLLNTMTSNLIYTPFYMKSVYSGNSIVWGDISFVLGGGMAQFVRNQSLGTIDYGIIFRFLLSPRWSAKIDLRGYHFAKEEIKPNLILGLNLAFNFGGAPEVLSEENTKLNSSEDW